MSAQLKGREDAVVSLLRFRKTAGLFGKENIPRESRNMAEVGKEAAFKLAVWLPPGARGAARAIPVVGKKVVKRTKNVADDVAQAASNTAAKVKAKAAPKAAPQAAPKAAPQAAPKAAPQAAPQPSGPGTALAVRPKTPPRGGSPALEVRAPSSQNRQTAWQKYRVPGMLAAGGLATAGTIGALSSGGDEENQQRARQYR